MAPQYADITKRFIGYILDSFIISFLVNIIIIPVLLLLAPVVIAAGPDSDAIIILIVLLVALGSLIFGVLAAYIYYIWIPVKKLNGATIGKKIVGIKVVSSDGSEVDQWQLFMREFIGKYISSLVFSLGYIWILVDLERKGWHDIIANTLVVEAE